MRTTVTLEPESEAIVRRLMRERSLTFKQALNAAVRAGGRAGRPPRRYRSPTFDMGIPRVPLEKALRLVGELEDEELIRRLATRK
jgi:hypothetical protein